MMVDYSELVEIIYKQLTTLSLQNEIKNGNKVEWLNPVATRGEDVWAEVNLSILDYEQNLVQKVYKINSDTKISVVKDVLSKLCDDPANMLIMAKGRDGGESLGLLSDLNVNRFREAIPGFYFYLKE